MPVYDYKCKEHGVFYDLATLANSAQPVACPKCQQLSPRIILLAPEVLAMASEKKQAMERNEKARHEPLLSNPDQRAEHADMHKSGCGCASQQRKSNLIYTADGKKMFPSMRPWMISH